MLITQHTLNNTTLESNLIIHTAKPTVHKSHSVTIHAQCPVREFYYSGRK